MGAPGLACTRGCRLALGHYRLEVQGIFAALVKSERAPLPPPVGSGGRTAQWTVLDVPTPNYGQVMELCSWPVLFRQLGFSHAFASNCKQVDTSMRSIPQFFWLFATLCDNFLRCQN